MDAGADYLLAVKANQPTLKAEIEDYFAADRDHTLMGDRALELQDRAVRPGRQRLELWLLLGKGLLHDPLGCHMNAGISETLARS